MRQETSDIFRLIASDGEASDGEASDGEASDGEASDGEARQRQRQACLCLRRPEAGGRRPEAGGPAGRSKFQIPYSNSGKSEFSMKPNGFEIAYRAGRKSEFLVKPNAFGIGPWAAGISCPWRHRPWQNLSPQTWVSLGSICLRLPRAWL